MLPFFPWLRIRPEMSPLSVGRYKLLRFVRGREPGAPDQIAVDAVLEPYVADARDQPVEQATLLQLNGHPLTADLTDAEVSDCFEFAELVALAGLSARRFFQPLGYTNRDVFTFVVQAFTEPGAGIGLHARRRDGGTGIYAAPGVYRVRQPYHIPTFEPAGLGVPLLEALLRARESKDWEPIGDALTFFNRANTDGEFVPEQWEIVATVGAFERLLESDHKEDNLVREFLKVWPAGADQPPCDRVPPERRGGRSILSVWLRDLFQQRSASAHGKLAAGGSPLWQIREHLLLGAFAFPLLVKVRLARAGHYALNDRDRTDIEVFELLICADHFQPREDGEVPQYPWNEIREGTYSRRMLRAALEHALEEQGRDPGRESG